MSEGPDVSSEDTTNKAKLLEIEAALRKTLLNFDVGGRMMIAALAMAIARIADATDDNAGAADYLAGMAETIRAGQAMEHRA